MNRVFARRCRVGNGPPLVGSMALSLVGAGFVLLAGCARDESPVAAQAGHDHPQGQAGQEHHGTPAPAGSAEDRLICQEHGCYEDECFICHPELRDAGRLWCNGHGRYEDRCFLCHPELENPARAFCETHGLYEDECFLCRPEVKGTGAEQASAREAAVLMCAEHELPESECGICHPELVGQATPGGGPKVRFASAEAAANAGLTLEAVRTRPLAGGIACYAETAFDQNRLAEIVIPIDGILHEVHADLGDRVEQGQLLATVRSPEISQAVAGARLARQTLERERTLRADRITTEGALQAAEAADRTAWQGLLALGFDAARIASLLERHDEHPMLPLRAPFAGEIVERDAVHGAWVEAGHALFRLADRSTLWAMLSIPERQLARVRVGQRVELELDALPGARFTGELTWIAADVDARTRMARARVVVPNPDGALRARMFARARILTGEPAGGLAVPQGAVQRNDGVPMVFVRHADDLFEARRVTLGSASDGYVEILDGLREHEWIVAANAFTAKSQLLLSRLGAGCVHD